MKYEKSSRVQYENYSSITEFLDDAIEMLNDEDNYENTVNIIAGKSILGEIIDFINLNTNDKFKFRLPIAELNKIEQSELYMFSIYIDGEVYLCSAIDKYGQYYDYDGFMFVHKNVDSGVYRGNNRRCDVIVFDF